MNLTEALHLDSPELLQRCVESFSFRAAQAGWPKQRAKPKIFAEIFECVERLIQNEDADLLTGLKEEREFLCTNGIPSKISYLSEFYLTAESVLRDSLLRGTSNKFCSTESIQLFEEVNGAFHTLLDRELSRCCSRCLAQFREDLVRTIPEASLLSTGALQWVHLYDQDEAQESPEPRYIQDDFPEIDICRVRIFFDQMQNEIIDAWHKNLKSPGETSNSQDPSREALQACYQTVVDCVSQEIVLSREVLTGAAHFGSLGAIHICIVGEEVCASFLSGCFLGNEASRLHARRAINQAFHALMRGTIYAECEACDWGHNR